jgi:integrase
MDRPIAEITPAEIAEVITAKAKGSGKVRPKPAMARNLLIHLKRLFRWAYDQHHEGRYGLAFSPAAQLSGKSLIGRKKARVRVLTDQELQRVYQAAASTDYLYPWGPLVRMLALTGQRLREVAEARWREFDLKNRTWTLPAVRMKGAKPHVVPIADDLLALLNDLPRFNRGDHLFSTTSGEKPVSGFANAKVRLDKLVGDIPPFVFHDVRRSVRTNLSAIKQIKKHVAERMIAHTQPGVEGVYDLYEYFNEKREGFALWENRLRSIVKSGEAET